MRRMGIRIKSTNASERGCRQWALHPRRSEPELDLFRKRADRLKADFQKTFGTEHGERVLMHLYERLHGKQTTMPNDGNPTTLAFNEGMRMTWLIIMEQMREEDIEIRVAYERYIGDKRREEISQ